MSIKKEALDFLVMLVKASKKFRHVSNDLVEKAILKEIRKRPSFHSILQRSSLKGFERNKTAKTLIRRVRSSLFPYTSMHYARKADKRYEYFDALKKNTDQEHAEEINRSILRCHTSSRERLQHYEGLYLDIFSITGQPKSILDIACGLNPFSLPFMGLADFDYIVSDADPPTCELLKDYFILTQSRGVKGKVLCLNILNDDDLETIRKLPIVDVCFLFKILDLLDKRGHKRSEMLLTAVNARYVIVSFATATISGKMMRKPRRAWFERMLQRLDYSYTLLTRKNEIFYVITKQ